MKIELSFEFYDIKNDYKANVALDENSIIYLSSNSEYYQSFSQDQLENNKMNSNSYFQMQWNPYYQNIITNSYPNVRYIPVVQGYSLYPQPQIVINQPSIYSTETQYNDDK